LQLSTEFGTITQKSKLGFCWVCERRIRGFWKQRKERVSLNLKLRTWLQLSCIKNYCTHCLSTHMEKCYVRCNTNTHSYTLLEWWRNWYPSSLPPRTCKVLYNAYICRVYTQLCAYWNPGKTAAKKISVAEACVLRKTRVKVRCLSMGVVLIQRNMVTLWHLLWRIELYAVHW
jgi:hypothetical protein